jgi:hypothetical protein
LWSPKITPTHKEESQGKEWERKLFKVPVRETERECREREKVIMMMMMIIWVLFLSLQPSSHCSLQIFPHSATAAAAAAAHV